MGALIAVLDKRGEDATDIAVTMLKALRTTEAEAFEIVTPFKVRTQANGLLERQKAGSSIIVGHILPQIPDSDRHHTTVLSEGVAMIFDGRAYRTSGESLGGEAVAQRLQHNCEQAAKTIVRETEGDFAFAVAEPSRLVAGRDPIGVRPLYYGENRDLAALSSRRRSLWKIGITRTDSFPPGHVALVDRGGFRFAPVRTLAYPRAKKTTMQTAAKELQTLLRHSIKLRVSGLKEVAVAFSGGLDSSLIALLAKKSKADVNLIHASLKNQSETEHAKRMAEELRLPIHVCLFAEEDLKRVLPEVLWLMEGEDPTGVSIGIPIHWAAEKASKMGLNVMLAGQGADEFFGGYKRYLDHYLSYGGEKTRRKMFDDVTKIHETNIERDFKICSRHNVELRLPFATFELAKFAAGLPLDLKMEARQDTLRKTVLRKTAEDLGLPESVVKRPKKAMQYATGVSRTLKKLAKKNGSSLEAYLGKMFQETFGRAM